jgi:adenylosuccinate synthase
MITKSARRRNCERGTRLTVSQQGSYVAVLWISHKHNIWSTGNDLRRHKRGESQAVAGTCVIGLQWGDEAKGKLVDLLAPDFDIVVRFLGGANAGHTVVSRGQKYKLHHIPSGILHKGVMNVVAPGVVIHPPKIMAEIDGLRDAGISVESTNLRLSERAHVVFPWHIVEDQVTDVHRVSGENIGTTLRGIGPCYRDKVGRTYAIRLGDLYRDNFRERIAQVLDAKISWLAGCGGKLEATAEEIYTEYARIAEGLRQFVGDTTHYLLDAVEAGERLLFEGAQGALLDLDHGTFPFVTSSNSSGVGVSAGSGVPARWIERVIGVIKTYCTRVGGGPFPTELTDSTGDRIRIRGNEFGTTTGRPRRCGWFDAVSARYSARLSGVNELSAMMLDVLSEFEEIKICAAYDIGGVITREFPADVEALRRAVPVWETLPGWKNDITGIRQWDDLPANAQQYLRRISELLGVPVSIVSVGPDRLQTIFRPSDYQTADAFPLARA